MNQDRQKIYTLTDKTDITFKLKEQKVIDPNIDRNQKMHIALICNPECFYVAYSPNGEIYTHRLLVLTLDQSVFTRVMVEKKRPSNDLIQWPNIKVKGSWQAQQFSRVLIYSLRSVQPPLSQKELDLKGWQHNALHIDIASRP